MATSTSSNTSVYRTALDATTATLAARGRAYRTLILIVALGILSILLAAALARSFAPLVLLLAVVAAVGIFFWLDARRLTHWRKRLLEPWQRRELDIAALRAALTAIPGLPPDTLTGMLTSLPQSQDLLEEQRVDSETRRELACALAARDAKHLRALFFRALVAVTIAVASAVVVSS